MVVSLQVYVLSRLYVPLSHFTHPAILPPFDMIDHEPYLTPAYPSHMASRKPLSEDRQIHHPRSTVTHHSGHGWPTLGYLLHVDISGRYGD